jgi:glycosyltransferase involved in cell wall biosynthesis
LAAKYGDVIKFHSPVPINEVRKLMREHDVYVLSSNGYEGWGAVVSEALEEGMSVIGTYEAGSSATILPESNLFHAGDWRRLKELLEGDVERVRIGPWTAKSAAEFLLTQRWG